MKRRTALQVIAAAQHQLVALAQPPASYRLQLFTPAQNEMLDQLTEMIIPADEHSPGARAAKVSLFIDLMVSHSSREVQEQWTSGLKLVEAEAQKRFHRPFVQCEAAQQDQILAAMAAGEADPKTDLERFFARLKLMTVRLLHVGDRNSPRASVQGQRYAGGVPRLPARGALSHTGKSALCIPAEFTSI